MNKVIEVNDRYKYYTVEPGVSFFDIYNAIQEQKADIWCSVPGRKSVGHNVEKFG